MTLTLLRQLHREGESLDLGDGRCGTVRFAWRLGADGEVLAVATSATSGLEWDELLVRAPAGMVVYEACGLAAAVLTAKEPRGPVSQMMTVLAAALLAVTDAPAWRQENRDPIGQTALLRAAADHAAALAAADKAAATQGEWVPA